MMLVDNLIHSDLHPGNILVRLNPPKGLLGLVYHALGAAQDKVRGGDGRWRGQGAQAGVCPVNARPALLRIHASLKSPPCTYAQVSGPTQLQLAALQRRWLQPQIVLLDVGMATEMTGEDQVNMIGLFRSFAKMDGRTCGNWVLQFSGAGGEGSAARGQTGSGAGHIV